MIRPDEFRETCKSVLGSANCTFKMRVTEGASAFPEEYYIDCYVGNDMSASLQVNRDLSTCAKVCLDMGANSEYANYVFTLRHLLKKYQRRANTVRNRLFGIYSKITGDIGGGTDNMLMTMQYLGNVEFYTPSKAIRLLESLYASLCQNRPEYKDRITHELADFFNKKLEEVAAEKEK